MVRGKIRKNSYFDNFLVDWAYAETVFLWSSAIFFLSGMIIVETLVISAKSQYLVFENLAMHACAMCKARKFLANGGLMD